MVFITRNIAVRIIYGCCIAPPLILLTAVILNKVHKKFFASWEDTAILCLFLLVVNLSNPFYDKIWCSLVFGQIRSVMDLISGLYTASSVNILVSGVGLLIAMGAEQLYLRHLEKWTFLVVGVIPLMLCINFVYKKCDYWRWFW